jgi:MFS family permease
VFDAVRVLRRVSADHTLVSMIVLAGLASLFLGTALQAVMPTFAQQMGTGDAGLAYGVLLFASGAGGVVGGLLMEATGRIKSSVPAAVVATALYGLASLGFAATRSYLIAVPMLFVAGITNLAATSVGQTVVQLRAPAAERGQVVGVYNVAANGLRAGSGLTVGALGAVMGVHWSFGLSSAALAVGAVAAGLYARRRPALSP